MQPLTITIPGEYWDTYLYRGHLYLFHRDGSIETLNWDKLLSAVPVDESLELPFWIAYCGSDYLYDKRLDRIRNDPEISSSLQKRFVQLSYNDWVLTPEIRDVISEGRQDNPLLFPHSDVTVYYNKLYSGSTSGISYANVAGRTKHSISTRTYQLFDGPCTSIAASYGQMAVSLGEEGLIALDVPTQGMVGISNNLQVIADNHCSGVEWAFHSIYGSSLRGEAFLADYHKYQDWRRSGSTTWRRKLLGIVSESKIFGAIGYSWGIQDKFFQATEDRVRVARYVPWSDEGERIQRLDDIRLRAWKGSVIGAGSGVFGSVIECDNALVVIRSDDRVWTFEEEPVNWRIFPRSKHYENQLHIITDDDLRIVSFNHDYFVDQDVKTSGIRFWGGSNPGHRQQTAGSAT